MVDNKSIWAYNNGIVNNKEQEMNELLINDKPYYGMFTDNGNAVIDGVVFCAKKMNWSWNLVNDMLTQISTVDGFGEATDTAVREYVYEAIFPQGE